jgi:hypothetical protein
MKSTTNLTDLKPKQIKSVIMSTLDWCFTNLKAPKRSRTFNGVKIPMPAMSVFISKRKGSQHIPANDALGEYSPFLNQITLVPSNIGSVVDLVEVIIHEYTHSTQKLTDYYKLDKKYGYLLNPYEVEARLVAATYADVCCYEILK